MPATTTRKLALAAAVAVTLGAGALTAATTASAAEVPLSGYELTWGIKQSYRTYVTTYAAGTFTPAGGATQAAGNGAFTFAQGTGSYDSDAHTVDLAFQGSLRIVSQLHGFDLTLSDVRFDSGAAEITADVTKDGTTTDDVPLATVTVTRAMTDMTTTLTKQAADVFGSASYEGAAGDPLTVAQTATESPSPSPTPSDSASASASQSPSPSASTSASPSGSASASPSPSASASESEEPPAEGDIADGILTWGVKESFRTYVVGSVAQGRITVSDGAAQAAGNGAFTFTGATGDYDTDAGTLSAAFEGAVDFKGHESNGTYGLDLTLGNIRATVDGGKGELTADVTSLGTTTEDVELADLTAASADLTPTDDVITLDDVTATLTEAGAKAFSGYYTAGTELDPLDLSVALTDDAQLPSGDGDDDATGTPTATASDGTAGSASGGVTGSTTGGTGVTGGALASTGADVPSGVLGAAAAVTVAAGAGVVYAMRRRRTGA
ncbi:HtaA domain-containing protein [Streptomyces sp. GbtcB6]|uniref:HtaA domain-containing protein n=1 Tax=Streptomyces sp. GbtcB6 TaxID=2824751 RepID=UPI001C3025D3|nr:HtaA domain-containing protein [Streptomyces sp. GbtcB6]